MLLIDWLRKKGCRDSEAYGFKNNRDYGERYEMKLGSFYGRLGC